MEKLDNSTKSRREFLKKSAYVVPTIVALGQVSNLQASCQTGSCIGEKREVEDRPVGDFGGKDKWGTKFGN